MGHAIRRRREIERRGNRDHRLHHLGKVRSRGKTESEGAAQGEADDGNALVSYAGVEICHRQAGVGEVSHSIHVMMAPGNRPAWRRAPKVQAYNRSAACHPRARRLQNVPACLTARQSGHQNHGWNRLSYSVEAGDESVPAFVTERYLETLPGVRRDSRKPSRKNIPYRLKVGRDPGPAGTKVWRCLHTSGVGRFFGLRPTSSNTCKIENPAR